MTYALKAFMISGDYVNNTIGETAKFLELSTLSLTSAKEKGYYSSTVYDTRTLVSFSSRLNDVPVTLPVGCSDHVHGLINAFIQRSIAAGIVEPVRDDLLAQLQLDLGDFVHSLDCGPIESDGFKWLPQWVSWGVSNLSDPDSSITVWLSDEAFRGEFDEYEITVIPPLPDVAVFLMPSAQVRDALAAVTRAANMEAVQIAKGGYPETVIGVLTVLYHDPLDPNVTYETDWTTLIYGSAGDNPDTVKESLRQYILNHSDKPQSVWEVIFPDIFKTTEFLVMPGWWTYALEQMLPIAAIYSGIMDVSQQLNLIRDWVVASNDTYSLAHVQDSMSAFTHNYRSLGVVLVGGPNNRGGKYLIKDWFPDYIPVPSTSVDFSRMANATMQWANALTSALIVAETWAPADTLPTELRKTTRNGVYWLVFTQDNVNYLIYPRYSAAYA